MAYDYDERGRLAVATDLAGGTWSYGYDEDGGLTTMVDPRGKTILAASHRDGRTATVRALHAQTAFHYGTDTTRAVDGLGRTTTFHRDAEGTTTGVADATGRLTQLAFDAGFRPVSISRDGTVVARMDYDAAGRLTALRRPDGDSTFGHGDHGLESVDGAGTARYRYEAGRVAHAEDGDGERAYAYTDDGVLASATAGGVETGLATRPDGVVHELRRDGVRLLGIGHRPDGRVVSMARGDGGVPNTVRYDYDARGFRTAAEYGGRVSSALGYDAAGNLVRYELATGGRTVLSQDYEIGDFNEVVRIRTGEGPDLSYGYDSAGRLTTAQAGARIATVAYDDLDRAVNCFVCTASLESASVAVETPSVVVQEEFDILLGAGGTCMVDQGGPQGGGFGVPVGPMWHHSVAFGDGSTATASGAFATIRHTYSSRGTFNVRDDVACSPCQSVFTLGFGSSSISVCKIRAVTSYPDVTSCRLLLQSDADYDINGCTASPDTVEGVIFGTVQGLIPVGSEATVEHYPCNQHDLCYETCATNRGTCDRRFEQDMVNACGTNEECEKVARGRARAVRLFGWFAFRREQKEHCLCCD